LIDGRPIRDPISGSAVFIIELVNSLNELKINPKLFLQGNQNKNKQLENFKFQKTVLSNGNKTIENIFYEIGFNSPKSYRKALKISHETYFGRLPFKADKSIATIHDVIPLDFPEWFTWKNSLFSKRNFRRQIKNADRCIFSSNYTKERVKHFGDIIGDYEVIPLAVSNYIHINAGSYLDFGKSSGLLSKVKPHSYVLAVGNIEPRKNLTLIAESIRKINKALSLDLDFVIAGHANFEAKKILEKVATKLGKNPIILGFVTNEQKIELYKHCACHVFASKYEGFGIPPVESIVIGSPTVIANNSSLKELIPNEVMSFDYDSVDNLSNAIENNLYMNSHNIIGDRIINYINFYKWERVAKDYLNIYRQLGYLDDQ
tara:strand:- start:6683 stop:7804 length:1122 start_codon:yes stop_codon:yes gene_type:complete